VILKLLLFFVEQFFPSKKFSFLTLADVTPMDFLFPLVALIVWPFNRDVPRPTHHQLAIFLQGWRHIVMLLELEALSQSPSSPS